MPGTEEKLMEGPQAAYVGIDPTADSLHIGHLVSVMILKHFQNCGHKPFALVGGATGMIGDPSMKSAERNLLDEETLAHNVACLKAQLGRFLDFDSDAPNKAELVNNYDWMILKLFPLCEVLQILPCRFRSVLFPPPSSEVWVSSKVSCKSAALI